MDTDRPDETDAASEPVELDVAATDVAVPLAEAPKTRLLLGTVAGLGVALAGVAIWALLLVYADREVLGVTVVAGLLVGYVVREVSRRSDLLPRVIAALLTAGLCAIGTPVAAAAVTADKTGVSFLTILKEQLPHAVDYLKNRNAVALVMFAAAVVIAFVSAAEPKPKKVKVAPAPLGEPAGDDVSE